MSRSILILGHEECHNVSRRECHAQIVSTTMMSAAVIVAAAIKQRLQALKHTMFQQCHKMEAAGSFHDYKGSQLSPLDISQYKDQVHCQCTP
jgi:hypothetical protein